VEPTPFLNAAAASTAIDSRPPQPKRGLGWRWIVILVALLNAPLFFNGCDSQKVRFTAGAIVPFAELTSAEQPWINTRLTWWSWWGVAGNVLVVAVGVWLATTKVRWIARLAQSRRFLGVLILVAVVFDSWLFWPPLWSHAVFDPTLQIWALVLTPAGGHSETSEPVQRIALQISARLYYAICVLGLTGLAFGVPAFLRRFFFVRSGPWWQIQLRGLIILMLVFGAAIGLVVRLLTLH
jgi:hypothetical protein